MHPRAHELIEHLSLQPHPEGGYYRELVRSDDRVVHPRHGQARSALTCIEYLLVEGTFSALHRVEQIEVWHHLEGDPLALHLLVEGKRAEKVILGKDLSTKQVMQHAVPPGVWQASVPLGAYTLCGCTVAPGFEFADFAMPSRAEMLELLPSHAELVHKLTRPG